MAETIKNEAPAASKYDKIIAEAETTVVDLGAGEEPNTPETADSYTEAENKGNSDNTANEGSATGDGKPDAKSTEPAAKPESKEPNSKGDKPKISELREARLKDLKRELAAIKKDKENAIQTKDLIEQKLLERQERDIERRMRAESLDTFYEAAKSEVQDYDTYEWLHRKYGNDFKNQPVFDSAIKQCKYPHGVVELLWTYMDNIGLAPEKFLNRSPAAIKKDIQDIELEYIAWQKQKKGESAQAPDAKESPKKQEPIKTIKAETDGNTDAGAPKEIDSLNLKDLLKEVRQNGGKNLK